MNNLHDDEQDRLHYNRGERYVKNIENLYKSVIKQISQLPFLEKVDKNKPFKISDYPILKKSLDRLFLELAKNISFQISSNSQTEWRFAEKKMVDLAKRYSNNPKYRTENLEALNAFLNRKDGGLNLSDRVWNYTKQFKNEIELGLDLGIGEGKSAAQIARELKSYLKDPDTLFRRVRDKHGNLHLSKNAENYHPGQGVYRSSYKNAERLARTETNMAYHEAVFEKYQQFDFVIGIEVRLSNNPNHCPFCAAMAGKYPKDFKFTGWHPNCRCTTIPILKPLEETEVEPKAVTELHKPFEEWIEKNKDKIQTAPKQPYFIQNNKRYVDRVLAKEDVLGGKLERLFKPRTREMYISFEPFSPIVREEFSKLKDKYQKRKLFNEILNDNNFKTIHIDEKTKRKTTLHPQSKEPDSANWGRTQIMAKSLNNVDKDVIFLPEYKDKPSADALIEFKGKYTIADFKYFTTTKSSNIANELRKTFKNIPTIVMQFDKIDTGILKATIEELKRKESLGNMIIINKYGKIKELEIVDLKTNKYEKMLKGFF